MPIDAVTPGNFIAVAHDFKMMLDNIARVVFPNDDGGKTITAREKKKGNFVTNKDEAIDDMLFEFLKMEFGCPVLSEERAHTWPLRTKSWWVIDPVDGTHNLGAGWPIFGIMGAHIVEEIPTFGFIYIPYPYGMRREMYVAGLGCGAWVMDNNGVTRISVAKEAELENSFILFEGPSSRMMNEITRIAQYAGGWRNCLSCAISYTSLAHDRGRARRTAGVVSLNNKPWDNLPAIPIILEAGGIVSGKDGRPVTVKNCTDVIAANNEKNHRRLMELI